MTQMDPRKDHQNEPTIVDKVGFAKKINTTKMFLKSGKPHKTKK